MRNNKRRKLALLSLLSIFGILFCGLSFYYKPLIYVSIPLSLIGGISFGKLLNYYLYKK